MEYSIVIPTYKRYQDLLLCIQSIVKQTRLPHSVIIVDDDELSDTEQSILRRLCEEQDIVWNYIRKDHRVVPRGTSQSRNIGFESCQTEICFIFDDDLIVDDRFAQQIMSVWDQHKEEENLVAVGGIITNNRLPSRLERWYNRLGGLQSSLAWDVNDAGFQVWDDGIPSISRGHYVHGGVAAYRVSLVRKLGGFKVMGLSRAALEDVEFCLHAKRSGYYMYVEPTGRVIHNHSLSGREHSYVTGYKEGYNRKVIYRAYGRHDLRGLVWFGWANLFWIMRSLLSGKYSKARGMIVGLCSSNLNTKE